jgi:hypothetical protein
MREFPSNENNLDDHQKRAECLFLFASGLRFYRHFPPSDGILYFYGGEILRARISRLAHFFRVASMALSLPGAGGRDEALV